MKNNFFIIELILYSVYNLLKKKCKILIDECIIYLSIISFLYIN